MKRKLLLLLSLVFVMATTLVCAVGCKQNSKPTHKHSYAATWSTDGTNHWHECECGDKIDLEAHKGGTATCTEKAECEVCRVKYGEVNANNHAGSEFNYVSNGNGTHKKTYECCGATAAESEACSGGQATECGKKNVCKDCLTEYGEPLAHDWKTEYKSDGTQHWHECSRTGCTAISDKENCAGGTATCTEKATCTTCGNEYGTALGHNYATTWSTDGTNHWHECSRCHDKKDLAAHSGGTATCTEQATCTACGTKYGDKKADNHTATTYRYEANNNGTHKKIHTCCGAVENATEACSGGQATECGKKNVCEHCNAQYGEALAHDLEHHAAKEATCTEKGWKAYDTCKRGCGYTTYEEVAPTGHSYAKIAAVAATYYTTGTALHYHCEGCQTNFIKNGDAYEEVTDESMLTLAMKTLAEEITVIDKDAENGSILNDIVADKVKEYDTTDITYVNAKKDGGTVYAVYFKRTTAMTAEEDVMKDESGSNLHNYGYSEFRIPVSGTIATLKFDYRLVDFKDDERCLTLGTTDKGYNMKSFLEYKHSNGNYTNETRDNGYGDKFFNNNGEWNHVEFNNEKADMQNILFKIYHFQGELIVANIEIVYAHTHTYAEVGEVAATYYTTGTALHYHCEGCQTDFIKNGDAYEEVTDESTLTLAMKTLAGEMTVVTKCDDSANLLNNIVTNKVKQMDTEDITYVNVAKGSETVYGVYFKRTAVTKPWGANHVNANNWGFSEFRVPVSGAIAGIKFDYRLVDKNRNEYFERTIEGDDINDDDKNVGMKSIIEYKYGTPNSDGTLSETYTNESKAINGKDNFVADGEWHTFTFNCAKENMMNILIKIYHLDGEIIVSNMEILLPEHTHTYAEVAEVAATYYTTGTALHYHCEGCQTNFIKNGDAYEEVTDESMLTLAMKTLAEEITVIDKDAENGSILNDIVADKVKEYDTTDITYVNAKKDGGTVYAVYFKRTTAMTAEEDVMKDESGSNLHNYGYSEFRIPVSGTIATLKFDYRLVDFKDDERCLTLGTTDKGYNMKSFLEYKHSNGNYTNETRDNGYGDKFFNNNGEWNHVEFNNEKADMQNILFKIYHFQGELIVANIEIVYA